MYVGTTRDTFLRENLEWLGKAKNWAKFSTVGSIGVVHKGHVHESMNLLQPYLPQVIHLHTFSCLQLKEFLYFILMICVGRPINFSLLGIWSVVCPWFDSRE